MARAKHLLTAAAVKAAKPPAMLHDGGGLYLKVEPGAEASEVAQRSWLLRYTAPGSRRRRWMGLGSGEAVTLKQARDAADAARKLLEAGADPIEQRRLGKAAAAVEAQHVRTFKQAALEYLETKRAEWSSDKHSKLWLATLDRYVFPFVGALPVSAFDTSRLIERTHLVYCTSKIPDGRTGGNRGRAAVMYCSDLCARNASQARARVHLERASRAEYMARCAARRESMLSIEVDCAHCGELFRPGYNVMRRRFCSKVCADAGKVRRARLLPEAVCASCGESFQPKGRDAKYCSAACYQEMRARATNGWRGVERQCWCAPRFSGCIRRRRLNRPVHAAAAGCSDASAQRRRTIPQPLIPRPERM